MSDRKITGQQLADRIMKATDELEEFVAKLGIKYEFYDIELAVIVGRIYLRSVMKAELEGEFSDIK
jgi:hypothetical protein